MNYSNEYINNLINQEIVFCDKIALEYNYPDNITHLLYIIIPAFILKYGTSCRLLIEKCFSMVPILINDRHDQIYQAYYFCVPNNSSGEITVDKGIVLNNYEGIALMQLLDNLVHEFNHAVNSINNGIKISGSIMVRTGIVYNYFDSRTLKFVKKGNENILEEVINTKQTEIIIDIIKSFANYNINNTVVENTLYAIYHSIDSNYKSNSYLLESIVCRKLLENKTFLSTLETLRFDGNVDDIHHFFDNIVGKDDSLLELSNLLNKSLELQKELIDTKWFKNIKINKIKEINKKALMIVEKFNQNTIYK